MQNLRKYEEGSIQILVNLEEHKTLNIEILKCDIFIKKMS